MINFYTNSLPQIMRMFFKTDQKQMVKSSITTWANYLSLPNVKMLMKCALTIFSYFSFVTFKSVFLILLAYVLINICPFYPYALLFDKCYY